ncbi:hypothetical protein GYMLUDRAFT_487055 [Collybiopsis luxurians FD-317 M1]|uniref:Uncharacterized protein n=1 Tax=Collybiopsis luxurians FD-317 M1 TaxID=944289 RepID=A0A0D0BH08_9AGAR|nr:hypothetical protein GYMLUDRAFT_487055 [Collybiopsis luxurians FD-317 M1]
MWKERDTRNSFKKLGWYMPEEFMGGNLFQWIVELHSFDEMLPIADDMKDSRKLDSTLFKIVSHLICFPSDYPLGPPLLRIIMPRFLQFMPGGGGHVQEADRFAPPPGGSQTTISRSNSQSQTWILDRQG